MSSLQDKAFEEWQRLFSFSDEKKEKEEIIKRKLNDRDDIAEA